MSDDLSKREDTPLVERMFSGITQASALPPVRRVPVAVVPYAPLREHKARLGSVYHLQRPAASIRLSPDAPATDVMTDLTTVAAVTVPGSATLDEATDTMIGRMVRSLFVVEAESTIVGMITSTDVMGERPIQVAHRLGIHQKDLTVREVMTPADRLEAIDLEDVLHARVGDIVATLRVSGRQHALVIERLPGGASDRVQMVRGIFSVTEIARRLGVPLQPTHDIPRTFAEIEAAIGS
jgi:CBS domain-containing protein